MKRTVPKDRHGRHWTMSEDAFLIGRRETWTIGAIAKALGRTPKAAYRRAQRQRCWPTRGSALTSGQAAELLGVTQQTMSKRARLGIVKARRVPGGSWWLFDRKMF